jgi:hypothetical protein
VSGKGCSTTKVRKIVCGSLFGRRFTAGSKFKRCRRCSVAAESGIPSRQCRRIATDHVVAGGDYRCRFSYGIVTGCITSGNG